MLLFDTEHGRMLSMVDAGAITAVRTAAASGVATELLGGLLAEVDEFIGEDFAEYSRIRLTPNGANNRNKVCHGWRFGT